AETAGNADWVISTSQPDPLRENTRPRDEADWTGALSAWGVALQQTGRYRLMTLPRNGRISFGDQGNALDLGQFDVFVVPEPNARFADDEKRAIMQFVKQGGGLFMIADHDGSDRNNDGIDSPAIWNDLMRDNPVASGDPFGFSFDIAAISRDNPRSIQSANDPILDGPFGRVSGSILRDGTTATLHPQNNPSVRGLLYLRQSDRDTGDVFFLTSTFGNGRVAAWGDSSPIDDGSGAPGERLFDGWNDPAGTNAALALNATEWLAGGEQASALPTPVPIAQPTSAPGAGGELVQNGDFEAGLDGWDASQGVAVDAQQSHSGSNAAVFCDVDNCEDTLAQTLELPQGAATLRFYALIDTQEQGRAFDFLT
ncbi:MAG TPA: hypothetical protein VFX76_05375, partial [Roseiflexaceae bacterium]|nr:hypothetical protein [Roseiflexaceae bacterium]